MPDRDVTKLVDFGRNDDEFLPLTKCVYCARAGKSLLLSVLW